ncbi:hypothetical protein J2S14_001408 [Lederbergia wuyishanensis]|uniref:Uncharacterized protein n=1 Tax=Lederbergia wuyishanensis TaxID=1347903 RepID=A0ABU0D2I1_9BACI|nr:hypothetical protein [Lederbergia wuyishanensis]
MIPTIRKKIITDTVKELGLSVAVIQVGGESGIQ